MPDIVTTDPEYIKLTAKQKNLIQGIVKPEAEALREFIVDGDIDELSDLDNTHKAATYKKIRKLLQTDNIVQSDIIDLIKLLAEEEVEDILYSLGRSRARRESDTDESAIACEDELGFDCTIFGWTLRCVEEIADDSAETIQRRLRGNKSRLKSKAQGDITYKQKLEDLDKLVDSMRGVMSPSEITQLKEDYLLDATELRDKMLAQKKKSKKQSTKKKGKKGSKGSKGSKGKKGKKGKKSKKGTKRRSRKK